MIEVMVLGTFYLKNDIKHDHSLPEIIKHLTSFSPTKIAVEYSHEDDSLLKKEYHDYIRKKIDLSSHGIHQIAFKVARTMKHKKLFAIDWQDNINKVQLSDITKGLRPKARSLLEDNILKEIRAYGQLLDKIHSEDSLLSLIRYENTDEMISKVSFLEDQLKHINFDSPQEKDKYLMTWQYRNLSITSNLINLLEKDERVIIFYSSQHVKTIKDMLRLSPQIKLVSPLDYL